jgi:hypothetical protein
MFALFGTTLATPNGTMELASLSTHVPITQNVATLLLPFTPTAVTTLFATPSQVRVHRFSLVLGIQHAMIHMPSPACFSVEIRPLKMSRITTPGWNWGATEHPL